MKTSCPFYILDVFAEKKYRGNQLAVIRNAASLSRAEMQAITREINYSETVFVLSDEKRNGGYDIRIFTPAKEIPFAGHPVLGAAYVIKEEIIGSPVERINVNTCVGKIPVFFGCEDGVENLWMSQQSPVFGQNLPRAELSRVLGIRVDEIDHRFPVQEVSTGLPFIIVPLVDIEVLKKVQVDLEEYRRLILNREAKAILVFCPVSAESYDLRVRVFADNYGVPEDPATGSGNGCLAGYLVKHQFFGKDKINLKVGQGHEIGRPSLVLIRAEKVGEKINIGVGGNVVMVVKGELLR